ncbi:MAG: radical SAM protein, partial [Candidatus Heimdallarchaeota archaeon]|nr:radical SAM protein [Candidatus Heimdallarchaeota archaeon]
MKIENINLEITDVCNLRCTMCDIWKEKKNDYFTVGMIRDIFSSDVLSEAVDITLTGGEVFLHPELFSLVEWIQYFRPRGIRTLSTNGVLTREIMSFMDHFYDSLSEDFSIHISFDGVNDHDAQRGVASKAQVLDTINLLKKNYHHLPVKIKYTITPLNYSDVLETYLFCRKNELEFKPKIVEYAPHYTNRLLKRAFVF